MMKRIIIAALALMAVATSCEEELTWMERWRRDIVGEWELAYAYQVNVESLERSDPTNPQAWRREEIPERLTFFEDGRSIIDTTHLGWYLELPARILTMGRHNYTVTGVSSDTLRFYHNERESGHGFINRSDSTYDCNHVYFRVR